VDEPPNGQNWAHEVKFDGYRIQARIEKGRVQLKTRKGLDWTDRFPEIARACAVLPDGLIDGEICALNAQGASDFSKLQQALSDGKTGALVFFLFDMMFCRDRDLRRLPLSERKAALEKILPAHEKSLRFVEHFQSSGDAMLAAACKMDLEGVISKQLDAPYQSGRADSWLKSKCRGGQEVVIGGWSDTAGKFRSLLVGTYRDGKLHYMGRVGTGYNARTAAELTARFKPLARASSPFTDLSRSKDVHWLEPKLVAEIEYATITADGLFRQASFKGLRQDKPAGTIVTETPVSTTKDKPMPNKSSSDDNQVLGITISHPEKPLWPKSGKEPAVTKLDLARYMAAAAPRILPHIQNRPISVVRAPDGIGGEHFFQRHELKGTAAPVLGIKVKGEKQPYLGVDSAKALVALAQQAVTEIHPWGSKPGDPEAPERIILDLDPAPDVSFDQVVAAAKNLKARLEKLGFTPFVKTTGGKGLHVVIAVKSDSWADAKAFAKAMALALEADDPDHFTTTIAKKARTGKIFVDYLRNDKTSTGVAPWSPRARDGAPVAVPLAWSQIKKGLDPKKFTIRTVPPLLKKADPWARLAASAKPLAPAMKKLGLT
jgi:bifunctional non-homologous end joining protein LigD